MENLGNLIQLIASILKLQNVNVLLLWVGFLEPKLNTRVISKEMHVVL